MQVRELMNRGKINVDIKTIPNLKHKLEKNQIHLYIDLKCRIN